VAMTGAADEEQARAKKSRWACACGFVVLHTALSTGRFERMDGSVMWLSAQDLLFDALVLSSLLALMCFQADLRASIREQDVKICRLHDGRPYAYSLMVLYWAYGATQAVRYDVLPSLLKPLKSQPLIAIMAEPQNHAFDIALYSLSAVFCAAAVIVYGQVVESHGRQPSIAAALFFTLGNCLFETALFVCWFLRGTWWCSPGAPAWMQAVCGYFWFSVLNGLVHKAMWDMSIFPPHLPQSVDGKQNGKLVAKFVSCLSVCSAGWLWSYWVHNDLIFAILSHGVVDFLGAQSQHLPPPWIYGGRPVFK